MRGLRATGWPPRWDAARLQPEVSTRCRRQLPWASSRCTFCWTRQGQHTSQVGRARPSPSFVIPASCVSSIGAVVGQFGTGFLSDPKEVRFTQFCAHFLPRAQSLVGTSPGGFGSQVFGKFKAAGVVVTTVGSATKNFADKSLWEVKSPPLSRT